MKSQQHLSNSPNPDTEITENPSHQREEYSSWPAIRFDVPPQRTYHFSRQFRTPANPNNFLKAVKWSPDGSCFPTSSEENTLRVFAIPDSGNEYVNSYSAPADEGLVADVDIESEKYRWMGSGRLDLYAIQRIVHLRQCNGSISFVPAPGFEGFGEPTSYNDDGESTNTDPSQEKPTKFSDGYLDVIIMRACLKLSLLSLMTGLSTGTHVKSPYVLYFKVKAFILEPGARAEDPMKEGIEDSDGEVLVRGKGAYKSDQKTLVVYDKLQITLDQGLSTLFSPLM